VGLRDRRTGGIDQTATFSVDEEIKAMLSNTIGLTAFRVCVQAAVLALVGIAGPALAQSAYDGSWSVVITTRGGACESGIRYGLQIVNGQVVSAAGGAADVRGRVSPSGAVAVSVQSGGQWANGSGHLNRASGGGVWRGQGSAGACSGTWAAQRMGYGAQAELPGRPLYNYAPRYYAPRYYQPAPLSGQY
jgi:hypothetical protein